MKKTAAARMLRYARRRAGLSQRALAALASVPQPAIARIERGAVSPRVDTLAELLGAAGASLEVVPAAGLGVDRSLIRASLGRTPEERIRTAGAAAQSLAPFWRDSRPAEFMPEAVIGLLGRHDVRYVLIGAMAAITRGSPLVTQAIDICYDREPGNLERLADALREVHAAPRGADPGLPFRLDARTLAKGDAFTFTTVVGWLDVMATPSGVAGYSELARTADAYELFGHRVLVASLDDLIRMKRAAGRRKDLLAVEELAALRDTIEQERT
jgi:transcriptional regulator with XRE-family HTH domain